MGGNDTIWAGTGTDVASYNGSLADYVIGTSSAFLTITDIRPANGDEGTDKLDSVEQMSFANGGLTVTGGDLMAGGSGADIFIFDQRVVAGNVDHITDFTSGADKFYLAPAMFSKANGSNVGQLNEADFFSGAAPAATVNAHIVYDTNSGNLYYNADGSGSGALTQVVVLDGHPLLASTDIVLI